MTDSLPPENPTIASLGVQPRLLDNRAPPEGLLRHLLSFFDVSRPGAHKVQIAEKLLPALIMSTSGTPVSQSDFDSALASLQAEGWIEPAPCPEGIKVPKLPDIPGVAALPPLTIHDPLAGRPGDHCFRTTPKGAKVARLCSDLLGSSGLWKLGSGSELEQVLLVLDAEFWTPFEKIDAACCCSLTEDVSASLERRVSEGLVERHRDSFRLTRSGLVSRAELAARHARLSAMAPTASRATTTRIPSHDESRAWLERLSEEDFAKLLVMPLLASMGFEDILYNNGALEYGKDVLGWKYDELRVPTWLGVVAKKGDVTGAASGSASAKTVLNQVEQVFDHDFVVPRTAQRGRVSRCWVVISGEFKQTARALVESSARAKLVQAHTRWLARDDVISLVNQHAPNLWEGLKPDEEAG